MNRFSGEKSLAGEELLPDLPEQKSDINVFIGLEVHRRVCPRSAPIHASRLRAKNTVKAIWRAQGPARADHDRGPARFVLPFVVGKFHCMLANMVAKLTLDKLGRIVLPKPVRDHLQLAAGDQLELESLDDRIMLRPLRGTAQLRKKHGVWVFHCGQPLSAATVRQTVEQVRREREEQNLGRSR